MAITRNWNDDIKMFLQQLYELYSIGWEHEPVESCGQPAAMIVFYDEQEIPQLSSC